VVLILSSWAVLCVPATQPSASWMILVASEPARTYVVAGRSRMCEGRALASSFCPRTLALCSTWGAKDRNRLPHGPRIQSATTPKKKRSLVEGPASCMRQPCLLSTGQVDRGRSLLLGPDMATQQCTRVHRTTCSAARPMMDSQACRMYQAAHSQFAEQEVLPSLFFFFLLLKAVGPSWLARPYF